MDREESPLRHACGHGLKMGMGMMERRGTLIRHLLKHESTSTDPRPIAKLKYYIGTDNRIKSEADIKWPNGTQSVDG